MTKSAEFIENFDQYVIPSYSRTPIVLIRGKGTKVWDVDGKVYLDFGTGISVVNLGHCHPRVVDAIRKQSEQLEHVSNLYYNLQQGRLAKMLSDLSLQGKCFFCNSGAEANESLIKLARFWGHKQKRYEVISMRNSFHGRTLATLTATGQDKVKKGFEPLPAGFVHAEFNNLDSIKAAITKKTAAVLVEAIQGEGGVIPAQPEFMQGLRALCDESGILMLCDEIQSGMGRSGHWFGYQAYEIEPDAFSMAKSLGNGYPIGCIVTNPKLADVLQPGTHASTFGGSPLACAAAIATIQTIEDEKLVENAAAMGKKFRESLQELTVKYKHVQEVRGMGLMLGLVLDQPAKPLEERMMDIGLLGLTTAENVMRFLPPINVTPAEIEEAMDIIDDCCAELLSEPSDLAKPDETPPEESKPDELKPATEATDASKPDASKAEESKPDETQPEESKPAEPKPATEETTEAKPEESKPEEPKPEEPKPATEETTETKPEVSKPIAEETAETKPEESKPEEPKPAAEEPAASKPEASKPSEEKPVAEEPHTEEADTKQA